MRTPFVLTLLLSILALAGAHTAGQELRVLHIKVVLVDADLSTTPVPRHALLISDNPATSTPRRVVTGLDGTVDVRLRPGNYTVESDRPVAFRGKAYQWTQVLDVVAGRDSILELTADNAEIGSVTAAAPTAAAPVENDPSFLLTEWQASVVSIWTATAHASGFVVGANGLVATSGRAVGSAASVEVQLTRSVKVAGSVLVSDPARDVAVVRIDPAVAPLRPLPLGCGQTTKTHVAAGHAIFAIGAPPLPPNEMTPGAVLRVEAHAIASDLLLRAGSEGGPVFAADGTVVGISSIADDSDARRDRNSRIIPVEDTCVLVAAAEKKVKETSPPGGAHLPVEPMRRLPENALKPEGGLKKDAERRTVGLTGYQLSSSDFDVTFMTPSLLDAARDTADTVLRRLMDFGNWSDYVAAAPPVLLVRVTPRLVEGFWTKVARGAAMTQGVMLPAIARLTSGFSRMRVLCGDREVAPIHPFRIDTRISESETISEGLYVFDPDALAPSCADLKVVLYSQKQPQKADARAVDSGMVQRIWDDFASYRATP